MRDLKRCWAGGLVLFVLLFVAGCKTTSTKPDLAGRCSKTRIDDLDARLSAQQLSQLQAVALAECRFHAWHFDDLQDFVIPVKVFSSDKGYRAYQRKISKTARSASGFYSASEHLIVVKSGPDMMKVMAHEAEHFWFRQGFPRDIKWLDEGLAEFFEYAEAKGETLLVKEQQHKRKRLQAWLETGHLPSLTEFLNWPNAVWKARETAPYPHLSRSLSWGLVYYLMSFEQGRLALSDTLSFLKRHPDVHPARALSMTYPGGIEALEHDFHAFLSGRIPQYLVFCTQAPQCSL